MYDKDKIKNNLTIEEIFDLVVELGGEPQWHQSHDFFIARTICHNHDGTGSHKLYYYNNTKLFHCFTGCEEPSFDIYQLIQKVKEYSLPEAVAFIALYFHISPEIEQNIEQNQLEDWEILKNYEVMKTSFQEKTKAELRIFNDTILMNLPQPHIMPWEQEGIKFEIIKDRGIRYDPSSQCVIIPHYNIDNELIGIRGRTLIKEEEEYGKYRPFRLLNNTMYNHPLGFNLYNINKSKDNMRRFQTAIVFEGEKSALLYASYFGVDQDISCAICGSSFVSYQAELLQSLNVKNLIIGFDKQFQDINSDEGKRWCNKLREIYKKYSPYFSISFLFDKWNFLDYKDSPIDKGPDVFMELYKRRIIL